VSVATVRNSPWTRSRETQAAERALLAQRRARYVTEVVWHSVSCVCQGCLGRDYYIDSTGEFIGIFLDRDPHLLARERSIAT